MPTYSDVYTAVGSNVSDIIVEDVRAIFNSLRNLYTCPLKSRGFEPEYGTMLYHYLYEPCDDMTALSIDNTIITATERWEPRVKLLKLQGLATPLPTGDGFSLYVPLLIPKLGKQVAYELTARR